MEIFLKFSAELMLAFFFNLFFYDEMRILRGFLPMSKNPELLWKFMEENMGKSDDCVFRAGCQWPGRTQLANIPVSSVLKEWIKASWKEDAGTIVSGEVS